MFGPSTEGSNGADVLDADYVGEWMVLEAAAAYAAMIGVAL